MGTQLGEKIKQLRKRAGMTQSELASKLGVSSSAVGMYEQDRREPDNKVLSKLCDIFGCTADYLLGRSVLPTSEISEEEARLLQAYRRCDDRARDMVQLALAPFAQDDTSSETA